jgi:polyisoprenoid-binding protein YceI
MKRLHILMSALILAAVGTSAIAKPVTYVSDQNHTFPRFSYSHLNFSTQLSRFNQTTAEMVLDQAAKTGAVSVTIDMKSVDTGSAMFNQHIQGPDFFDTAKFPTATFKSTRVVFDGDHPVSVDGNLTIKGITRPATLTVSAFQAAPHPMLKKNAIGANAFTVVKRSDFGAGAYAPAVGDEVRIDVAIEAIEK